MTIIVRNGKYQNTDTPDENKNDSWIWETGAGPKKQKESLEWLLN